MMKIKSYFFQEKFPNNWCISKFQLNDINLIAGLSGVGKTRLLNTIFNLGLMMNKKRDISIGEWEIDFNIDKSNYKYELIIDRHIKKNFNYIYKEKLFIEDELVIDRNKDEFYYNEKLLPKLSTTDLGIYLLRDEDKISKIHDGFSKIFIRRNNPNFQGQIESQTGIGLLDESILEKKKITMNEILYNYTNKMNVQLYFLEKYFPNKFKQIVNDFKEIFPFVSDLHVNLYDKFNKSKFPNLPAGSTLPIIAINEKNVKGEIEHINFSSGMLRALIQLLDMHTIPKDSIYLIDEVENSMGVKSLPVMLDLLFDYSDKVQFIFTTHHPLLFNNVNIKYWKILTRKGGEVKIVDGRTLSKRFKKSYQENYIQLINSELIEKGI